MTEVTTIKAVKPVPNNTFDDALTEILRNGARQMLQAAIEQEVAAYIEDNKNVTDMYGHRLVVRNGHHPERSIQTGIGDIRITKPKVNDKRVDSEGNRFRFNSSIIPPYLKRSKSIEEFLPWLYLRGISTGDFNQALEALLGVDAKGLSANTIVRLKEAWQDEYKDWCKRDFTGKNYVYIWADGVYPRIRLEEGRPQCMLVIMGATVDGKKELIALKEGQRESELSWTDVLLDLKKQGLKHAPQIAVGDGALGFWIALSKVFPETQIQRCWVHKTCNILDKLPKSQHDVAKARIHDIWMASTRKEATESFDTFCELFGPKYEKAVQCLVKDKNELLAFYDFPAEHWKHLRTTNPIESMFATIKLRTKRTKGHGNAQAALSMAFKLAKCAEKRWNRLAGSELLADVISLEFKFVDGVKKKAA